MSKKFLSVKFLAEDENRIAEAMRISNEIGLTKYMVADIEENVTGRGIVEDPAGNIMFLDDGLEKGPYKYSIYKCWCTLPEYFRLRRQFKAVGLW